MMLAILGKCPPWQYSKHSKHGIDGNNGNHGIDVNNGIDGKMASMAIMPTVRLTWASCRSPPSPTQPCSMNTKPYDVIW